MLTIHTKLVSIIVSKIRLFVNFQSVDVEELG